MKNFFKVVLFTVGIVLIPQNFSNAQLPVTDVAAATALTEQNLMSSEMVTIQTSMNELQSSIEKAKTSAAWVNDLKTAKKMYNLLNSTLCNLQKLLWLQKNTRGLSNCFFQFRYDFAMVQITSSAENLMVALSSFSMERNSRMQLLAQSMSSLSEAQYAIASLNAQAAMAYFDQQAYSDAQATFCMSPYKKVKR